MKRLPAIPKTLWAIVGLLLGSASYALAQVPPAPTLASPTGSVPTGSPTFTWNPVAGATDYQLYVFRGTVVSFNSWLKEASVCSGSSCSNTPSMVLTPHDYQWKVRAKSASGTGAWSAVMSFNAAPTNWKGSACTNFALGDFNGDGRTDRLCYLSGVMNVSLATSEGFSGAFQSPASWLYSATGTPMVADMDGDGKSDLVVYVDSSGQFYVARSLGTSFADKVLWGKASGSSGGTDYTCRVDSYVAGTGDFNGDGLVDVFCKTTTNGRIFVGINTGAAFSFSIFATYTCDSTGERVGAIDLDADGKTDWYCIGKNAIFNGLLSNGTTFQTGTFGWFGPFCALVDWQIADLNGDGRPDMACGYTRIALSTGRWFLDQGSFPTNGCTPSAVFPADVDGDGTAELLCNLNGAPIDDIKVRRWDGNALTTPTVWKGSWCPGKVFPADFNGDGKIDLLCATDQSVVVAGTSGVQADLMIEAHNGLGGSTQVAYTPSTSFPDAHQPSAAFPNTNNAPVRQLVTSLTVRDGRTEPAMSTYSYAGGRMDSQAHEFLGYGYVRSTAPCLAGETACPYSETWFSQEVPSAGSPTLAQRKDGAANVLEASSSTYTNSAASILPRTSVMSRADHYTYAEDASKQTYSTYAHDSYGNTTQEVFSGDPAVSGDELQTDLTYVPATSAFIVNRRARVSRRVPAGSELAATEYLYDGASTYDQAPAQGNLTKIRGLMTAGSYVSRKMVYDAWGNVTSASDESSTAPTNRTITTSYDDTYHLFPVTVSNSADESVSTVWDQACGVPTQVTDANGQITTLQYDTLCRSTRTDIPLGGYVLRSYPDLGNPSFQRARVETPAPTGSTGNDWSEDLFDGLGRVYRSGKRGPSGAQSILVDRTYNPRGAVDTITAPFYESDTPPEPTRYFYDAMDRSTTLRHPDNAEVQTSYGPWSQTVTDENGKPSTARYDAYGRVIVQERTLNGQPVQTLSSYDPLGRLTGMTDALGNSWSWTFDALGRNTSRNDPDAGVWSYEYDDAGRVTSQTDAKNQTTTFAYDSAGRLSSKVSPVGTVTLTRSERRANFFNVGRVTTVAAPGPTTLKTDYDALGRPVKATRTLDALDYVAQRRYDSSGSLTGITYPDDDAVGTTGSPLLYDEAGRLRTIPGIVNQVTYDASGRPTVQANANGTQTTRTYDADRGFLEQIHTSGSSVIQNLGYTNDSVGQVTQVTSPITNEDWGYKYDDLYRLTRATNLSTPANTQTWDYDEIGRITNNSRVGAYEYPLPGSPRPHAPSNVDGAVYSYDSNGNLIQGGGRTPIWDAENRITQIGTTEFTYDESWERLKKATDGTASLYPFGDDYEVTAGQITKYVSIDGLGVVAKRVGMGGGAETFWLHTDRLGSIQSITNAAGDEVLRRTYRPYGDTIADSTSHAESRGWIDQRQDGETGLTYLHARYYDQTTGVFLSPDPLPPGWPGVGTNRYAYAFGNPVNGTDRSGLRWHCVTQTHHGNPGDSDPREGSPHQHTQCVWIDDYSGEPWADSAYDDLDPMREPGGRRGGGPRDSQANSPEDPSSNEGANGACPAAGCPSPEEPPTICQGPQCPRFQDQTTVTATASTVFQIPPTSLVPTSAPIGIHYDTSWMPSPEAYTYYGFNAAQDISAIPVVGGQIGGPAAWAWFGITIWAKYNDWPPKPPAREWKPNCHLCH